MANTAIALRPKPRLPKPNYIPIDDSSWQILTDSTFPTATDPNVIALAWELCHVRKLDIFRKPYHIVKIWNALAGREVEQLMPGINELLVTASRTGAFAGVDEPVYGKEIVETFHGRRKKKDRGQEVWVEAEVTIAYPETISIKVYRFVQGRKCAFSIPVRWREEYQRVGPSPLPNDMWKKRVYDQCQKVALAASLRIAFSDVCDGDPEDLSIAQAIGEAEIIDAEPQATAKAAELQQDKQPEPKLPEAPVDPETGEVSPHEVKFVDTENGERETWQQWAARMMAAVVTSKDEPEVDQWCGKNAKNFDEFKKEAPVMFGRLEAAINKHRNKLKAGLDRKPEA